MALSDDTKWTIGVGASVIAAIGWAVIHLTGLQTEMEGRLSESITSTENRLTQRIDHVDNRFREDLVEVQVRLGKQIDNVAAELKAVEGETASLAGLEVRLTETIQASENRLSRGLQDTEQRLTVRIDKIDDRLLEVEGESARLSAIVKGSLAPGEVSWPLEAGNLSELIIDDTDPFTDPETVEAMKKAGLKVQWIGKPVRYRVPNQALFEAYRQALQNHPEVVEEIAQAYAELVRKQLGLKAGDAAPSE